MFKHQSTWYSSVIDDLYLWMVKKLSDLSSGAPGYCMDKPAQISASHYVDISGVAICIFNMVANIIDNYYSSSFSYVK